MANSFRLLIAPLNWGLGHASRCIPVIRAMIDQKAEVVLASDGRAAQLLREEFPKLPLYELPSYSIRYPSNNMLFNMAMQLPRISGAIYRERKAVEKLVREEGIGTILSDNRYGCYTENTHNIFLTHQLRIRTPYNWIDSILERINKRMLAPFDQIWVPDYPGKDNLSGRLSHNCTFSRQQYIGPLSRMKKGEQFREQDVIVVLSGPEPQRSILETELLEQAKLMPQLSFLFVLGKPESAKDLQPAPNVRMCSFMTADVLNRAMLGSRYIISRSGYSTIMDLHALGRTALLIPTPGQTEQEYLADHFEQRKVFVVQRQGSLRLSEGLERLAGCGWENQSPDELNLHELVKKTIKRDTKTFGQYQ